MSYTKIEHYEKEYLDAHHDSALNVTEGVEEKPVVNPYFVRKKRRQMTTDEYVAGILDGNITILAQAITLIESNNPVHYAQGDYRALSPTFWQVRAHRYHGCSRCWKVELH